MLQQATEVADYSISTDLESCLSQPYKKTVPESPSWLDSLVYQKLRRSTKRHARCLMYFGYVLLICSVILSVLVLVEIFTGDFVELATKFTVEEDKDRVTDSTAEFDAVYAKLTNPLVRLLRSALKLAVRVGTASLGYLLIKATSRLIR
mmetsp:Transcript_39437/g.60252  ORF Transcript_39437/g.60252 Transcript_39437/m.60252 type:complete len:149 (+) Transcript_39437:3-449(+)